MTEYFQNLFITVETFLKEDTTFVFVIIAGIIFLLLSIIGMILLRKMKKIDKLKKEQMREEASLTKEINLRADHKSLEQQLKILDNLSKKFFKQYLSLELELNYLEIAEILKKKHKTSMMYFCMSMNSALYSGEELTKEKILMLENEFSDILKKIKTQRN